MAVARLCEQCGKPFESRDPRVTHCSIACGHKTGYAKRTYKDELRACKICGSLYHPKMSTQSYCGEDCLGESRKRNARERMRSLRASR
jgi:hypothetical protein